MTFGPHSSRSRVEILERIAEEYHLNDQVPDKFIEDSCQEYCCEWLTSVVSDSDQVIELGYGEGITSAKILHKAKSLSIIEGAPKLAHKARINLPGAHVIENLFEDYMPKNKYDKILALHVFEHVDDPVSLARHLRNWLNPDGEIIAIVPNRESIHRQLAVTMGLTESLSTLSERDYLVGHQRVYSFNSLENDLSSAGFDCIERKGFFLKLLPNSMMLEFSPELIDGLNRISDNLPPNLLANIAVRAKLPS